MKKVLIISPYFPPTNAADMQRVRMSLPFFKEFGWEAEVATVDTRHSYLGKDELLLQSLPGDVKIHTVGAFSKKWTQKAGLGSIALRSLLFYKKYVDNLLEKKNFDLIYFSTTQFPVCILGRYWKRRFDVPYVIDIQDPWHSEYYQDKPGSERPPKYWFAYRLNKYLERLAMKHVDGLISVSDAYLDTLKERYPRLSNVPMETITFGYFRKDLQLAEEKVDEIGDIVALDPSEVNLVYVGRGGFDMQPAVRLMFSTFRNMLDQYPQKFVRFKFYFIGTSYAPAGQGVETIAPVADEFGLSSHVEEHTDRISYYETLKILRRADALVIPGSNDPSYTASKIYPYLLMDKPLLAVFKQSSSAYHIVKSTNSGYAADVDSENAIEVISSFYQSLNLQGAMEFDKDWLKLEKYSAKNMTLKQCELFERVLQGNYRN
ncbi:MAG: glycosyltransferase family 4 protein [Sphingobacteriaceae bacterium]|jgi:glycosyltransferase involved in cell wall biosynthesis|nr:glycosyltransferase family 4 protein [Sphingobacteriaceae bacterium]